MNTHDRAAGIGLLSSLAATLSLPDNGIARD